MTGYIFHYLITSFPNFFPFFFFQYLTNFYGLIILFSVLAVLIVFETVDHIIFWPICRQIQCTRFARFFVTSLVISFHVSMVQLTIARRGGGLKFPAGVSWLIPSSASHLTYFSLVNALNGLFHLGFGCILCTHKEQCSYQFSLHEVKTWRFPSCGICQNTLSIAQTSPFAFLKTIIVGNFLPSPLQQGTRKREIFRNQLIR